MAITITDDAATISTTEYSLPADSTTLTAQTTICRMQAFIDFANMIAGDQYQVRVYETINGGAQLVVDEAVLTGVQPGPYVTPALMVGNGWNVTVKRLAGSDRSIAWSLRKENVLTAVAEGSTTVAGILSLIAAAVQGDATGLEGASQTFKGIDGTTTRIAATYASGTRTVTARTPV